MSALSPFPAMKAAAPKKKTDWLSSLLTALMILGLITWFIRRAQHDRAQSEENRRAFIQQAQARP